MNILIVDDEALARERLVAMLEELPGEFTIEQAENGKQAIEQHARFKPDVMLLDIRMPVMDGLEVAQHLQQLEQPPAIVFTTAYGDHALEAFDAAAVDYLLKPIKTQRLQAALEKSQQIQHGKRSLLPAENAARTHLSAKTGVGLKLLPVGDILYFRAEQKYVVAVHAEGELLLDDTLKALEDEFDSQFCASIATRWYRLRRCKHWNGRPMAVRYCVYLASVNL